MVVVLPAPFGPSRPKHSPALHLEIEAVDRDDVAVALDEPAAPQREPGVKPLRRRRLRVASERVGQREQSESCSALRLSALSRVGFRMRSRRASQRRRRVVADDRVVAIRAGGDDRRPARPTPPRETRCSAARPAGRSSKRRTPLRRRRPSPAASRRPARTRASCARSRRELRDRLARRSDTPCRRRSSSSPSSTSSLVSDERVEAVDARGVAHGDRVVPAAAARPTGRRAVLLAALAQALAHLVVQLGRQRPLADARRVGLGHAEHAVDRLRPDAEPGADAADRARSTR